MADKNAALNRANKAKQDEFYTQLSDIEKEMRHYRKHFKDKTVFCNCDDPFESNFFKYFVLNFKKLGLKKLICTCYTGSPIANRQLSLFDVVETKEEDKPYKAIITTVYDKTGDGALDMEDIKELFKSGENELTELEGNGDFASDECLELMDESDIVVTNPPFSLFRKYVATLMEHNKKFIIIGNQNAISYKEIFSLLKNNTVWLGNNNGDMSFMVPDTYEARETRFWIDENGQKWRSMGNISWFTNLDIKKRHDDMILVKRYSPEIYLNYDNFNAINVSQTADIPCDYAGVMGVPITFLDKYNPEQFEILGITQGWDDNRIKEYPKQTQVSSKGVKSTVSKLNDGPAIKVDKPPVGKTYYIVDNEYYIKVYARILIRNKHPEPPKEI